MYSQVEPPHQSSVVQPQYVTPNSGALVPYQPQSQLVTATSLPVVSYTGGVGQVVTYEPQRNWLYEGEVDTDIKPYRMPHSGPPVVERRPIYLGSLLRPLMDESYLAAHLSHQAQVSHFGAPGESLQFQSTTGRANVLTVISVSQDTTDCGWRILGDPQTNYVVFRGSPDWRYPLFDSSLTSLYDIAPNTTFRVHNMFLQELNQHVGIILQNLRSQPKARTVVTGHGNGGALAVVLFLLMQRAGYSRHRLTCYTFGSPLVVQGNPETKAPLPENFQKNIHNFVNEDDPVPSLLGAKDLHSVDQLLGRYDNPLKTGRHSVADLKAYKPMGKWYHLTKNHSMFDVPQTREGFFLDIRRGRGTMAERLAHHGVERYVSKLRQLVNDN
eukprot:NODE_3262_length_1386_cov_157.021378_g2837_i0.p1 GENE.NODE_3262_length_1386_cov_157.021378_g2837_i0~~NODE_3262_length_1386_cov_157.021378_g2837_i0.p1  ORF type:complete len:384 (+),score=50.94 NODE_3262_length_1386_cov_157.021378_g2837_i0:65-1216(+)